MNRKKLFLLLLSCSLGISSYAGDIEFSGGDWKMILKEDTKKIDIACNDATVLTGTYASVKYNKASGTEETTLNTDDCTGVELVRSDLSDNFGSGEKVSLDYSFSGNTHLIQDFYFYDNYPYFLVRVTIKDTEAVSSNQLIPLMSQSSSTFLAKDDSNRILYVPWDNDGFSRYAARKFGGETISSHEATAIYSAQSRKGLIAGSVEHDTWKSAVVVHALATGTVDYFKCLSGYTNQSTTRDALPHGKVTGAEVRSALFMIGLYDDWRKGMDAFAHANTLVAPPAPWEGGDPFGWSSWGAMQTRINYQGCMDVADFLSQDVFKNAGFVDEKGRTILSLDAWYNDNMNNEELSSLATHCKEKNGLIGAYAGFLCRWDWENRESPLYPNCPYKVKDILLKVNGEEYKNPANGALCVDPTHPGTIAAMKYSIINYAKLGFNYIKIDFMDCGICEGDSYYVQDITTGVQAYNYFMKQMYEYIQQKMPGAYTVLAMSPMFPYQYTTGRRTTCDAWGSVPNAQYVLNATSYGWWTDKLYTVNDPDHLVMIGVDYDSNQNVKSVVEFSEGTNRIRLTSGAITGAYMVGDNFSDNCKYGNGTVVGNPGLSRERALKLLTNTDINEMVRLCGAFYPINGHEGTTASVLGADYVYADKYAEDGSEKLFMYETSASVYVAVFAYKDAQNATIDFARIGVHPNNVSEIKELWEGKTVSFTSTGFTYDVPKQDVRVYRISKKKVDVSIEETTVGTDALAIARIGNKVHISSETEIDTVALYSLSGGILSVDKVSDCEVEIDTASYTSGVYVVKVVLKNGEIIAKKLVSIGV